jgi:anaphase-promoting complex subunit 1
MAEVCLGELGRPPGPEMENCTDRESYSLAAGLALGMITLGQGESLNNGALSDLNLPESLYYHMVGGPRPDNLNRHKFRSPSYQGNSLKGVDKKSVRREGQEPIKRVFTYFLFSVTPFF